MENPQETLGRRTTGRPTVDEAHQAALMIDFDNVTMGIRSNLGQELRNLLNSDVIRGKVAVQRAYADWRRYPQYIVPLSEASIDLIFAPAYGSSKKNATDIRLAIDALELVFVRPEIKTFILMSGDSDFSSLVLKLKEYGKYVIGVGIQESSSDLLVQNCDEYYSYSALSGLSKSGDEPRERHDPWILTEKAIEKMVQRNDTMRSDRLKQVMLEIDPAFNERELGYNRFNRFIVEAASRGSLSIQKMENGQYGVAPAEKGDRAAKPRGEEEKGRGERRQRPAERAASPPRGRTSRARPKLTLETALQTLDRALDILLSDDTESVRDSDVKRKLLELDSSFDEGELGYSKFSKFLQAAEEEGLLGLTRGPNGNYHVERRKTRGERAHGDRQKKRGSRETPQPRDERPETESKSKSKSKPPSQPAIKRIARLLFGERPAETEPATAPAEDVGAKPKDDGEELEPERSRPSQVHSEQETSRQAATGATGKQRRPDGGSRGPRARGGREATRSRSESRRSGSEGQGPQRTGRGPRSSRPTEGREASSGGRQMRGRRGGRREEQGRGERQVAGRRSESGPESGTVAEAIAKVREDAERGVLVDDGGGRERKAAPRRDRAAAEQREKAPAEALDEPTGVAGSEAGESGTGSRERRESSVAPAPMPGAPRGTIRGRWGSRGRYRPAEAPPPIFEGQRTPRGKPEEMPARAGEAGGEGAAEGQEASGAIASGGIASDGAGLAAIARLKGYPGVGEKTAETLVGAFGSSVFRVLDEQPERVRELLSDHRAEQVIEARRRERGERDD